MTLNDPYPSFKVTPFFDAEYLRNGEIFKTAERKKRYTYKVLPDVS